MQKLACALSFKVVGSAEFVIHRRKKTLILYVHQLIAWPIDSTASCIYFSHLMRTSHHLDDVSGGDRVALVVQGNGSRLAWLDSMLWYSQLLPVLIQHFKHLLLQSYNHANCLLTVSVCGWSL